MKILKRKSNQYKELGSLSYPVSISNRLAKDLDKLFLPLLKEYKQVIIPLTQDSQSKSITKALERIRARYLPRIELLAQELADKYVAQLNKNSIKSMSNLGLNFDFENQSPNMKSVINKSITGFVGMIKSVEETQFKKIESLVQKSISATGEGQKTILEGLSAMVGTTAKQAERISLDQIRKITSVMNSERAKEAGVTQFKWLHSSGAKHPRPLHVEADGQIFDINDPPAIGDNGEPVLPGIDYNCGCRMVILTSF